MMRHREPSLRIQRAMFRLGRVVACLLLLTLDPSAAWLLGQPSNIPMTVTEGKRPFRDNASKHSPITVPVPPKSLPLQQACRSVAASIAGVICGAVLMTTGATTTTTATMNGPEEFFWMILRPQPPLVHAIELQTTVSQPSNIQSTSFISAPVLSSSSIRLAANQNEVVAPETALDEVWTLINKYYIDRSFANQDWEAVKNKYDQALAKSNHDPAKEMKLVTEMVGSLGDKYSRVLSPEQYSAIQKYDLIGVGATFMPNADKQIIVGAPPIPGSAAAQVGLQVGDIVQAVNGRPTNGRTAFDIIDQLAEDPDVGTITLTIRKPNSPPNQATDYILARQFQKIKDPVKFQITEQRPDGTKVGLVRISEFNALVKPKLEHALQSLQSQGANAYVLDLRGNGGGAFQSAVEISSLFVNQQVATYVVDGTTAEIPFTSAADRLLVPPGQPLVIWMDGRTASAAEVLAAALHDNCRAVLLGDKSFGKGLIQAVYGLQNGAGLVLTVAKYVTPNHDEIQGIGLQPDAPGMVPSNILSGLVGQYSSDTSQVDFQALSKQLNMCKPPESTSKSSSVLTATPE